MRTEVYFLDETNRIGVIKVLSNSLLNGDICIIPTDTVYGVVAIDNFKKSVKRIYDIKRRPEGKHFIRLIGSLSSVADYTKQEIPDSLKKYWPGPLTIIFQGIAGGAVALRYPDDIFLSLLFQAIEYRVLVAPSANISGQDIIYSCDELIETFDGEVSTIVCLKNGLQGKRASTIVDISGERWKILRQGAVHIDV